MNRPQLNIWFGLQWRPVLGGGVELKEDEEEKEEDEDEEEEWTTEVRFQMGADSGPDPAQTRHRPGPDPAQTRHRPGI